ncbi:hypothetical protein [Knoellia sp. p5-6-4]|uniref:hypothetical protein n=1 Tax=unclassified Knoellia TaxID=2618719 RepID=UPI0023DC0D24|nr:hypothetical protein [Knoellia sp. p5-6-4]MDF2146350.1 hypothetical protein [Knoellia sp. p5-6-4]
MEVSPYELARLRGLHLAALNRRQDEEAGRLKAEMGVIRAAEALDKYGDLDDDQAARLKAFVDERTRR